MVFVSLGMPRASLQSLVLAAERARALLVLRGVRNGDMQATAAFIQELIGKRQVAWQIDPSLFKTFNVKVVPTLVLIDPRQPVLRSCGGGQCTDALYASLEGDVTIGWGLERLVQLQPRLAPAAALYQQRLREVAK